MKNLVIAVIALLIGAAALMWAGESARKGDGMGEGTAEAGEMGLSETEISVMGATAAGAGETKSNETKSDSTESGGANDDCYGCDFGSKVSSGETCIPETVEYEQREMYTTYFGDFAPVAEVFERNEYMTLHPTVLTAEESEWYVTADGGDGEAVMRRVARLSDEICRGLESDYDKAYALAMWVGENVAYDFDTADNGSAREVICLESIFENDFRTTCGGFANLYAALCDAQGIYCLCLKGAAVSEGYTRGGLWDIPTNHNWNAVAIDGRWYYADCTWISDRSYIGGKTVPTEEVRPFYALMGFGEMSIEHRIDRCEVRGFM
ncbi:MAG: hypothetical protein NC078_05465 [Ruminococcus sp.]|nr:hypothetical protein [Ruminococcus sp.]